MKKQIRSNVFETNSSSTHAICIAKNRQYNSLPRSIIFGHGEYGWEYDTAYDTANYLHEMIHSVYSGQEKSALEIKDKIDEVLKKYGVESEWEDDHFCEYKLMDGSTHTYYDSGYIDHGSATVELLNDLLSDEDLLMTFLFGDAFIITGNDNCDSFEARMHDFKKHIDGKYGGWDEYYEDYKKEFDPYDIYHKGN